MDRHINFEDNIFIVNVRIRMIQDLLILDTDPELFLAKTLEDLDFINSSLAFLLSALRENTRLFDRDGMFFNLADSERQFYEVMQEIVRGEGSLTTAEYPALGEKTSDLQKKSLERRKIIGELLAATKKPLVQEPVVGHDELYELLSR